MDEHTSEELGTEIDITADEADALYDGPLPDALAIRSVHVRRNGVLLGRGWYLQTYGDGPGVVVSLRGDDGFGNRAQSLLKRWLHANGYEYDDWPGSAEYYRRGR